MANHTKRTGIYKITNKENGKCYIGSSKDITRRFSQHRGNLRNNRHHSRHLQNAWNLYGEDAFTYEILEECSADTLIAREQHYISTLSPEYNVMVVVQETITHCQETKKKIGQRTKGKTYDELYGPEKAAELRQRRSEALKGKPKSDEHKKKCRVAALGHTPHNKGKTASEETKAKVREARAKQVMGPMTEAQKEKIRQAHKATGHRPASRKGIPSKLKGRTYEDIYGPEKAAEMREARRLGRLGKVKT